MTDSARLAAFALALSLPIVVTAAAPASARTWKLVREAPVAQGTVVVAFLDEQRSFSTGCTAPIHRSVDGGQSWSPGYAKDLCRYGTEAVPGLVVNVGAGGDVRVSPDVGVHYERVASFGEAYPHHPRHLSFLDTKRGVVATDEDVGFTDDGAHTWQRLLPPEPVDRIAAVSIAEDGDRLVLRLLDETGALWRSDDRGRTWTSAPSPLRVPVLPSTKGPTAALRFRGAEGVLAATLDDGGALAGHVYRTKDGGKTWAEEEVAVPFRGATLTLSADGTILSAVDVGGAIANPDGATVKAYRVQ